jgi:hypothetical protein
MSHALLFRNFQPIAQTLRDDKLSEKACVPVISRLRQESNCCFRMQRFLPMGGDHHVVWLCLFQGQGSSGGTVGSGHL